MKKKYLLVLIFLFVFLLVHPCSFAKSGSYVTPKVKIAINKYKVGNYAGCLQDCLRLVYGSESNNPLVYYYLANCYVKAGKKANALYYYDKVLENNPGTILSEYATNGKKCVGNPASCKLDVNNSSELDKFVASPPYDGLSPYVRKDFEQKHLDSIKNDINADKELDAYSFRKLNYDDSVSTSNKIAQNKPTDADVKAALKVLNDAGVSPYDAQSNVLGPEQQTYSSSQGYQNPELTQLNAMMGGNNQSGNKNSMMDMLPFMLSQDKNGGSNYSPQLMQAVIMNSMMSDLNYNLNENK